MKRLFALELILVGLLVQGLALGQAVQPIRIMPLGDSITQAAEGHASYRYWLWQRLQRDGFEVDFVGSMKDNYGGAPRFSDFDSDHEGHWGWRIDQVLPKLDGWLATAKPQIVLCHLGSNDIREPIPQIVAEMGQLLDKIRAYDTDCVMLVARLIPIGKYAKVGQVNEAFAEMVAARRKTDKKVLLVDHYTGFDGETDNYDKVHPNEGGEKLMAARWFTALEPLLRNLGKP